jgi:hypothetical protein
MASLSRLGAREAMVRLTAFNSVVMARHTWPIDNPSPGLRAPYALSPLSRGEGRNEAFCLN